MISLTSASAFADMNELRMILLKEALHFKYGDAPADRNVEEFIKDYLFALTDVGLTSLYRQTHSDVTGEIDFEHFWRELSKHEMRVTVAPAPKKYSDFEPFSKDQAYWERNQLLAAFSKIMPAWLAKHDPEDKTWEDEWRNIVVIGGLTKDFKIVQMTWHIHDDDLVYFKHLKLDPTFKWDGHTTDQKYDRLATLSSGGVFLFEDNL
jgi:hypothetical protein